MPGGIRYGRRKTGGWTSSTVEPVAFLPLSPAFGARGPLAMMAAAGALDATVSDAEQRGVAGRRHRRGSIPATSSASEGIHRYVEHGARRVGVGVALPY